MDETLPPSGKPEELKTQVPVQPPAEEDAISSFKRDLQLFGRAFTRYKYLILALCSVISFIVFVHCKMQTPIYYTKAKVLIEPPAQEAQEIVQFKKQGGESVDEMTLATEKDLIESRIVAERIVPNLGLTKVAPFKDSPDPVALVIDMIDVKVSLRSRVINIGARSPDPVLAAKVANGAVNAYIEVSDEKEKTYTEKTLQQMRTEVTALKARLRKDQDKVKEYEVEHPGVISRERLEEELKRLNGEVAEVSGERLTLRTELGELAAFQKQGYNLWDHPRIAQAPSVAQILSQIQQRRVELTQLLKIYKERFPLVAEKKAELTQLQEILGEQKKEVVEEMKSKYILLGAREQELRKAVDAKSEELSNLLEEMAPYEALLGEVEISKNLYALMLERMNKAGIIGRSPQTRAKVLSPALVPSSPAWPRTGRNVLSAFLFSLGGISYLAYFFFLMFKPIESEEEITEGLKIPVLAQIPDFGHGEKGEGQLIVDQEEGFGKDALHLLRASLLAGNHHTLLFTSALPTEGKTFLVHNLGVFLAREGWRVLLFGTDFRDPRLRVRMKVEVDGQAIEDYLEGRCTEQQTVHASSEPRLFYLGPGKALKNSLAALTSPKFQKLIQDMSHQFDFVFLDSPPLQLFPDGEILAQGVKDVIVVVRSQKTPLKTLMKTVEKIERNGTHVTGTVLNFKSLAWRNYYYYNYYYGKGERQGLARHLMEGTKQVLADTKERVIEVYQFLERRLFARFRVALPLELTHTTPEGEKHHLWGVITDLSEGGLLAEYLEEKETPQIDPADFKLLDLKIKLSEKERILVKGEVVRISRKAKEVHLGIEFCEISEEDRNKIKHYLGSGF